MVTNMGTVLCCWQALLTPSRNELPSSQCSGEAGGKKKEVLMTGLIHKLITNEPWMDYSTQEVQWPCKLVDKLNNINCFHFQGSWMAWASKKMSDLGATLTLFSKSKSTCLSVLPPSELASYETGLSGALHISNSEELLHFWSFLCRYAQELTDSWVWDCWTNSVKICSSGIYILKCSITLNQWCLNITECQNHLGIFFKMQGSWCHLQKSSFVTYCPDHWV